MTIVLVHGVPETAGVWDAVRARLDGPSMAVELAGFGSPTPPGFAGGRDAQVDWILRQLDAVPDPIDLIGHDWGSLLTLRIATAHPDRVRSWAVDVAAVSHPDYVWHDFARQWQTPGGGEQRMEKMLATRADDSGNFFSQLVHVGVPPAECQKMASHFDATMASAILDLYRSAVPNVHTGWEAASSGRSVRPGLILQATADPFDDADRSTQVAQALGADVLRLEGLGHFWMVEDPAVAATAINQWVSRHA
ncbi:Pimeloyl-ACP methyl ester carboxylesterase [Frankia sp. AiPs1]|uniref:alpha/beta fold hydrolase n=1 Tax=Frankia sp. AiPa1 TaxID=573492 RepID=UPI00202B8848|nr:alpha/beta fold hydrolase [Frankia sp. AiPa1]MCL9760219.1 alpha/beta hydrolase [Frankia sp. AiPa1]